jgi:hypothetical protein
MFVVIMTIIVILVAFTFLLWIDNLWDWANKNPGTVPAIIIKLFGWPFRLFSNILIIFGLAHRANQTRDWWHKGGK